MGMSIDEAITRYKNNAEYERTHGNLQGCLEFRQLAEWLEKLEKIEDLVNDCADESVDDTSCCARYIGLIEEVIYTGEQKDGNNNQHN